MYIDRCRGLYFASQPQGAFSRRPDYANPAGYSPLSEADYRRGGYVGGPYRAGGSAPNRAGLHARVDYQVSCPQSGSKQTCTHIHTYTHAHMHTCTHPHMHTCTPYCSQHNATHRTRQRVLCNMQRTIRIRVPPQMTTCSSDSAYSHQSGRPSTGRPEALKAVVVLWSERATALVGPGCQACRGSVELTAAVCQA